jgi:hypothetical protein
MEVFGNYVRQQFQSQPERFYFIPNVGPWITTRDTCDYGAFADGAMVEFFASAGPFDLYDIGDWELEMNRVLGLVRRGKAVLCQPITSDEWNIGERLYNLASYLLIKGNATFYNLVFGENSFGRLVWFPECGISLGPYVQDAPADISSLYDAPSGCYLRRYKNGLVYVNPTWEGRSVALDKEYFTPDSAAMAGNAAVDVAEDGSGPGPLAYRRVSGSVPVPAKGGLLLVTDIADASEQHSALPPAPELEAYPQPCSRSVTLRFRVPEQSGGSSGDITLYTSLGRVLYQEPLHAAAAGWNSIALAAGQRGFPELPSGLYMLRLRIAQQGRPPLVAHRRFVILP